MSEAATEPCGDQAAGDGTLEDSRPSNPLDKTLCVSGLVNRTTMIDLSMPIFNGSRDCFLLSSPSAIYCVQGRASRAPPYRWAPKLAGLVLAIRHQVLCSQFKGYSLLGMHTLTH